MSFLNTNYSHIDGSDIKAYQDQNTYVHNIGSKQSDETKKDTLQNDVVTLSKESDTQNKENSNTYSHNRYQARMAYLSQENTQSFSTSKETSSSTTDENEDKYSLEKIFNQDKADDSTKTDDTNENGEKVSDTNDKKANGEVLTDEEQQEVDSMKERDTEVKTHERAHQSAGGQYASAPVYEKEKGPDGKDYVTDGHVNIDVSEESTPEKTIEKMQIVIKSARAPAEPSSQDLKVASQAQQTMSEARAQLREEQTKSEDIDTKSNNSDESTDSSTIANNSSTPASTLSA